LPDVPDAQPDLSVDGAGDTLPYLLPTAATDIYLGATSLVLDGTKAYITVAADTSLKVLDVSNPLSPRYWDRSHGYSDSQLAAHAIHNNIVWIVRSSCCGYGYATSLFGVDVSNPASPSVAALCSCKRRFHSSRGGAICSSIRAICSCRITPKTRSTS